MPDEVVQKILQAYGKQWARIDPPQKGYRNESRRIVLQGGSLANLMLYKREAGIVERIRRANTVSGFLAERGQPARQLLDPRIIRLQAGDRTKYGALYYYLPGKTIPWDAYTKAHIKNLGQSLQALHSALRAAPRLGPEVADEYLAIVDRMERYFSDANVRRAMQRKLGCQIDGKCFRRYRGVLGLCKTLPNQQMLHMDFVRGNILFDEQASITGVLDFEKTAWGHPLFDIARTLAFLLVDCKYKSARDVRKYFLHSGYAKTNGRVFRTVRAGDLDLLEELVNLFLVYDFYKFLRHNPYESLGENEHFVRTLMFLRQRSLCWQDNLQGTYYEKRLGALAATQSAFRQYEQS